ncbi:unnamed protein product [Schistosoma curassoni]|uniref:Uncharacterized protein n=1 Tax=Schistosoma curassoni TaxID=6186 RepID=A0A183JQC6_9TREM|nr:unnamed protein product [Schistosoma curassoni]
MIYGSDSYTPENWIEFRDANVYTIFARLFLSNSPSAEDKASDPSQAFLFWILYKVSSFFCCMCFMLKKYLSNVN